MTGTARRNREVGQAIRDAVPFLEPGEGSQFPDAWCCDPVACRVQHLLVGICELGIPGSFQR